MASVTLDSSAIRSLTQPGGDVDLDMHRRAQMAQARSQMSAPVDTGRMRAAAATQRANDYPPGSWEVAFLVGYSLYVDQGTRFMAGRPFLSDSVQAAL